MPPRRDVEGEIYAQLYGEPPEPHDPASTRVIGDDPREFPAREQPELGPTRRQSLEALAGAAAQRTAGVWAAIRSAGLWTALRSIAARATSPRALRRERRGLAIGALAAGVVGLGAVAGLSVGSGGEAASGTATPSERSAAERSAEAEAAAREASEARDARRRRAARKKRRAARRGAAERASASTADVPRTSPPSSAKVVCVRGAGCFPEGTVLKLKRRGDEEAVAQRPQRPQRVDVEKPRVRTSVGEGGSSGASGPSDMDVDVDVDVPEVR